MRRMFRHLAALCTVGLLAACGGGGGSSDPATAVDTRNLASALATSGQTSTMASAADLAGLTAAMSGSTNYTLLMPNDEAMAPFSEELAELTKPENREALASYV